MAARDFTAERFKAQGIWLVGDTLSTKVEAAASLDEDRALARALAARWNACADALAVLEPRDGIFNTPAGSDAWAILRRAIYGDEHAA